MKQKNPPKSVGLLRKFKSTSRSIITGQVEFPVGILKLDTNLYWLEQVGVKPLSDDELEIIEAYHAQIIDYPLGEEKSNWEPNTLRKLKAELAELTQEYQPLIINILSRVLQVSE